MANSVSSSNRIRERALYWFVRLRSGEIDAAERVEFERWLAASPAHRQAYEALRAVWDDLPRPDAELAEARRYARGRRTLRRVLGPAFAAALALTVVGGLAAHEGWPLSDTGLYRTAKGEWRTVTLADGTRVELDSDTVLAVRYGWFSRSVELERGQALFSVEPGKLRPFEVWASGASIRDIGTRFTVHRRPSSVRVAVLEGAVRIRLGEAGEERQVNQGQMASYTDKGVLTDAEPADLSAATAWREGKLIFRRTPLPEVLAELGRYHPVVFQVTDPALEGLALSGVFKADNLPLFLTTLEAVLPVKTHRVEDGSIVVERAKR